MTLRMKSKAEYSTDLKEAGIEVCSRFDRFTRSLPSVLFWGLTLTSIWVFGFEAAIATIVLNLAFVGLPVVMLIRWMMKRRDEGQIF